MKWLFAAMLLPVTAAAQPAPQLHDVDRRDRAATTHAYAIFRQHCPGLTVAAPYIVSIQLDDMASVLSDDAKQRNWTLAVSVGIKLRDGEASSRWQTENKTVNSVLFTLGTGSDPGISSTGAGYRFCTGSDSGFIKTPDLRLPKKWPSDVAERNAHPHRNLDSSVYPLGEGPAIPAGR